MRKCLLRLEVSITNSAPNFGVAKQKSQMVRKTLSSCWWNLSKVETSIEKVNYMNLKLSLLKHSHAAIISKSDLIASNFCRKEPSIICVSACMIQICADMVIINNTDLLEIRITPRSDLN